MAVLGLTEEDFASEAVEVWPENQRAYEIFNSLGGAWRFRQCGMDPAIAIGLERAEIKATLELENVPRADWPQFFEDLRVMESAALEAMRQE